MTKIVHYPANTSGKDWAVGDIHGHFTLLQQALDAAGFDPAVDRLFSVGDVVDRGPESSQVLEWLDKPWFFAVRGNHETMAIDHTRNRDLDRDTYLANGGEWFVELELDQQRVHAERFAQLPIAIEIDTPSGLVGIVHADCPFQGWGDLRNHLQGGIAPTHRIEQWCQWSRGRFDHGNTDGVAGVRAMVVGHTPTRHATALGNVHFIDTGAWLGRFFTLMNLHSLECVPPAKSPLEWT